MDEIISNIYFNSCFWGKGGREDLNLPGGPYFTNLKTYFGSSDEGDEVSGFIAFSQ